MKYYHYRPDADRYAGIGLNRTDRDIIRIRGVPDPVADQWKPIEVVVFDDNPDVEGDFPSLADYNMIPVMSERAWKALRPLIGYCCEALPIVHPSGHPFYIIHVMETIDALDRNRSDVKRYSDGGIMRVVAYSFKEEMLKGKHIFKLPSHSGGELLVDDEFRKAVEDNNLKGLDFREIQMVNQGN